MVFLGIGIWVVSAALAYFVAEVVVLNCDRREWDRAHRRVIGVGSILLGPVALLLSLKALLFVWMAKDAEHRFTLHFHN